MEGQINVFTILATMINFAVFYCILRHFLFAPVNNTLNSRETEIINRLKNTEENEKKADLLRIQNEQNIKNAKEEGKNIVQNYKVKAEGISKDIVDNANNEANIIMDRTKKELEREKEKTEEELKLQVVDLAVMLSSKSLEKGLDEKQHRRLIEDFITKVGI